MLIQLSHMSDPRSSVCMGKWIKSTEEQRKTLSSSVASVVSAWIRKDRSPASSKYGGNRGTVVLRCRVKALSWYPFQCSKNVMARNLQKAEDAGKELDLKTSVLQLLPSKVPGYRMLQSGQAFQCHELSLSLFVSRNCCCTRPSRECIGAAWNLYEKFSGPNLGGSTTAPQTSTPSMLPLPSFTHQRLLMRQFCNNWALRGQVGLLWLSEFKKLSRFTQTPPGLGEATTVTIKRTVPSLPRVSAEKRPQTLRLWRLKLVLFLWCDSVGTSHWGLQVCEPGDDSGPNLSLLIVSKLRLVMVQKQFCVPRP